MFGRATIRLGIGPHSSYLYFHSDTSIILNFDSDVDFWATVCKTVCRLLSDRCRVCKAVIGLATFSAHIVIYLMLIRRADT